MNIQCVVDDKKVLWATYAHKGASHDSCAFRDTESYDSLVKKVNWLNEKDLFLLGDIAYAIESLIISLYDLAKSGTEKDHFNFYHSSAWTTVEYAFGEIDVHWNIFWKKLTTSLENAFVIIEGQCANIVSWLDIEMIMIHILTIDEMRYSLIYTVQQLLYVRTYS